MLNQFKVIKKILSQFSQLKKVISSLQSKQKREIREKKLIRNLTNQIKNNTNRIITKMAI